MIDQLYHAAAEKHPSFPLALAAMVEQVDSNGAARFGELAVGYRKDYLELQRKEFGEAQQRGLLSMDEVRRHLQFSVLPRLVSEVLLYPVAPSVYYDAIVRFKP